MKVYVLVYEENSDYKCGSTNSLYLSLEQAQEQMKTSYTESIAAAPIHKADDSHYCEIGEMSAVIVKGLDSYTWRIEENNDLDVKAIIHLHGGLVQEVFSTADFSVSVYDTDSDDMEEAAEIEAMKKHMQELCEDPAWLEIIP